MALGEGAALVALVREGDEHGAAVRFFVSGFGASTDAVHVTAPDRTGGGVARAAEGALRDAGLPASACSLVSAHATSTPFNDAMEARAIARVFGAPGPIVQPFKAQIGHTLGAAGVLETLAIASALEHHVAPPAAGAGALDADASVRLIERAEPLVCDAALKLSAAFGGANAALVIERASSTPRADARPRARAYLKAVAVAAVADAPSVAQASGEPHDKVARLDPLSLLLATAVAKLGRARVAGAGIVVGHALATLDINERFFSRVIARGPTAAEPRLFPATSPNVMPGQLAILFGLTGPSAATASGPGGALGPLALAVDLVVSGRADRMIASAVDVLGPASRDVLAAAFADEGHDVLDGAVAALIDRDPEGALCAIDDLLATDHTAERAPGFGHRALAEELLRRGKSA
jgi:3-oxoacyl-[acyl-carrier-protein] synthase-1/3-oxoacyl-[acyl-carrier-protein] synthase II